MISRVLVSSVSAKVPMVRAVKKGFLKVDGKTEVWGADCNPECLAREVVDGFILMDPLDKLKLSDFLDTLLQNHITHIIPSRDGELLFYSEYSEQFASHGIKVMISSEKAIETCLDKLRFYEDCHTNMPIIPTYQQPDKSSDRWVVKERFGAASSGIAIAVTIDDAITHGARLNAAIYQPFIDGLEYSVDLYLSKGGDCMGCVVRSRDHVINGESKITTSRSRSDISQLAIKLAKTIGLRGHVLVQIIEDAQAGLNVVEINPRYGGASGLSVALGLDSFQWFSRESRGEDIAGMGLSGYAENMRMLKSNFSETITTYEN